ncbi:hypothetical protein GQ600_16041 [Phytophthora cactorum]|nr:hypothetical protein GQ600_16041 [Phytophthora cactorum]
MPVSEVVSADLSAWEELQPQALVELPQRRTAKLPPRRLRTAGQGKRDCHNYGQTAELPELRTAELPELPARVLRPSRRDTACSAPSEPSDSVMLNGSRGCVDQLSHLAYMREVAERTSRIVAAPLTSLTDVCAGRRIQSRTVMTVSAAWRSFEARVGGSGVWRLYYTVILYCTRKRHHPYGPPHTC